LEELVATMATEPTLRDEWVTRAEAQVEEVTWRVCHCTRPHEPPCTKPDTDSKQHGTATAQRPVVDHCMSGKIAMDAQRRMVLAQHTTDDPLNWPGIIMTGEDKAKMTQFGGSFYPVYFRPGNLSHKVWTSEKACHLWALLPEYRPDPEEKHAKDRRGDVGRHKKAELHAKCMAYLTLQVEMAARHGIKVLVTEGGTHGPW